MKKLFIAEYPDGGTSWCWATDEDDAKKYFTKADDLDEDEIENAEIFCIYEAMLSTESKKVKEQAEAAKNIITNLLDILEDVDDLYSSRDEVLKADIWLRWYDDELSDEKKKEFGLS